MDDTRPLHVVYLGDDASFAGDLTEQLSPRRIPLKVSSVSGQQAFASTRMPVVLDLDDERNDGLSQLAAMCEQACPSPVIVVASDATPALARCAQKLGAEAFFTKPLMSTAAFADAVSAAFDKLARWEQVRMRVAVSENCESPTAVAQLAESWL